MSKEEEVRARSLALPPEFVYIHPKHMKKRILTLTLLGLTSLLLNSCWPLLVGAGAAGGYMVRDRGIKVQPPVTNDGGGQYDTGAY